MTTITKKAKRYLKQLEVKTRDNGTTYVIFKGELFTNVNKSKLYNAIYEAHCDRFPNDWIYGTFYSLLEKITEYDIEDVDKLEDLRSEMVDSMVDVCTKDLTKWLDSDVNNVYYLTEAMDNGVQDDGFKLLAMAQYIAIDEVMEEVINLLSK